MPLRIFEANRHAIAFDSDLLLGLLTPAKLFRRRLLDERGLRFPEGRRRLEDHVFVVGAYFAAERISVLADRPVYHWMRREEQDNASYQRFDAAGLLRQRARGARRRRGQHAARPAARRAAACTGTAARCSAASAARDWLWRDEDFRRELYEAVRALALERFGEDVHDRLPFNLRLRSTLLRRGDFDALGRLSRYERRLQPVVRIREIERGGTHLVLRLESWLGTDDAQAALRAPRRPHVLGAADGQPRRRPCPRRTARSPASCGARTPTCSCATSTTRASTCCPRAPGCG